MKKVYVAPQTEAIEILADKVLMASPGGPGFVAPHVGMGTGTFNGAGE
jgi:hypothetical protein